MGRPSERLQRGDHDPGLLERRVGLGEPAGEPPQRVPLAAGPIAKGAQAGELERLEQVDVPDLASRRLGEEQVAALERSAKGGSRMPLGSRTRSCPGAERGRAYRSRKEGSFGLTSSWAQALRKRVERGRVQ